MHIVSEAGGSQAEFDMEITEFEKNKKISMHTVGASKLKIQTSDVFEPTAKGTKVTGTMDYELPYSILGKIVDKLSPQRPREINGKKPKKPKRGSRKVVYICLLSTEYDKMPMLMLFALQVKK
jgi:uncharacterized membrane protein